MEDINIVMQQIISELSKERPVFLKKEFFKPFFMRLDSFEIISMTIELMPFIGF